MRENFPFSSICLGIDQFSGAEFLKVLNPRNSRNPQLAISHKLSGQRAPNSCDWIFQRPEFISWSRCERSGLLWLNGRPGTGKSLLASAISDNLLETKLPVFRYFHGGRSGGTDPAIDLMQMLLGQISATLPNGLPRKLMDFLSGTEIRRSEPLGPAEFEQVFAAFLESLNALPAAIFIIDGLDSLPEAVASIVGQGLLKAASNNQPKRCQLRVLGTSRGPGPKAAFSWGIDLNGMATFLKQELSSHLFQSLEPLSNAASNVRKAVVDTLAIHAQATLQWIVMSFEMLTGPSVTGDLQKTFELPPQDIGLLHLQTMKNMPAEDVGDVQIIFAWLLTAIRPLRTIELRQVLDMAKPCRTADQDLQDFTKSLKHKCRGLVTCSKDGTIHFTHSTTKDFFMSGNRSESKHPAMARAHDIVSRTCLEILVRKEEQSIGEPIQVASDDSLIGYAHCHWSYHVRQSLHHGNNIAGLLHRLLSHLSHWWLCKHQNSSHQCPSDTPQQLLNVGLFYGIPHLTTISLEMGADLNRKLCDQCPSPLSLAILGGHYDTNGHLFQQEVCPSEIANSDALDSLCLAVSQGRNDIVRFLIERGSPINERTLDQGWMPLHFAVVSDRSSTAETLLYNGADIACQTRDTEETPLHLAANAGLSDTLKCLIRHLHPSNQEVNAYDKVVKQAYFRDWCEDLHQYCPLDRESFWDLDSQEAAECDLDSLSITASNNVINAKTKLGSTALHLAASNGHETATRLLLEAGSDLDMQDGNGHTAIHLASQNGHLSVVSLLIQHGTTLSQPIAPILEATQRNGHTKTADLLIWYKFILEATGRLQGQWPLAKFAAHSKTTLLQKAMQFDRHRNPYFVTTANLPFR